MVRKSQQLRPVMTRIPEGLRHRLEREAELNRRSMNAEIIHRLEQSFRKSEDAELTANTLRAAFGEQTGDLFRTIATAIWLIEKQTGKKWHQDEETSSRAFLAITDIFRTFVRGRIGPERALRLREKDEPSPEVLRELAELPGDWKAFVETDAAANAAVLEALQNMGLAPSDAEIEEYQRTQEQAAPKKDEDK